jgi:hypothetical protein
MRFKGTLVLLITVIALGSYVYFYEVKGKEARTKAKATEKQFWKIEGKDIRQIEIASPGQKIAAVLENSNEWLLTSPRQLDADSDEIRRLADTAAKIEQESVVEENAANLEKFGLRPAQSSLKLKTKDGKEYILNFGIKNPTGNSVYASFPNQNRIFLIASQFLSFFDKKVDDLRNHTVLSFEQPEAQSLSIQSPKGAIDLFKDSTDRWWFKGMENRAADSPQVRGVLNALSMGKIKEFFNDSPGDYANLSLDKPLLEAAVSYGKDKAIKRLILLSEKSKLEKKGEKRKEQGSVSDGLYLAKDASRPDLFFVDKDLVDKLLIPPDAIRDKALVPMQRWDIDSITLTNSKGSFEFSKSSGEWVLARKKKVKWDAVNGILDAMEKPVNGWVDKPSSPSMYGLDKPSIHIVLKQGGHIIADCSFGKSAKNGIYAQIKGDPSVKIASPDGLSTLDRSESDYLEAPAAAGNAPKK